MPWANECQEKIFKILPSPAKNHFLHSAELALEVEKIHWFDSLKLPIQVQKAYTLLPPHEWEAVLLAPEHPEGGNLEAESRLCRGGPELFL